MVQPKGFYVAAILSVLAGLGWAVQSGSPQGCWLELTGATAGVELDGESFLSSFFSACKTHQGGYHAGLAARVTVAKRVQGMRTQDVTLQQAPVSTQAGCLDPRRLHPTRQCMTTCVNIEGLH